MSLPDDCGQLLSGDDSEAASPIAAAPGPTRTWRRTVAAGVGLVLLAGTALLLGGHTSQTQKGALWPRSGAGSIVALSADAGSDLYKDFLDAKGMTGMCGMKNRTFHLGPLPFITEELKAAGKDPPKDLVYDEKYRLLSFSGSDGALLLPSLENKCKLDSITILVGVNSDSYNRGLGVAIEPALDPSHPAKRGGGASGTSTRSFVYNGYGLTKGTDRNVIKFHPNFRGGQLRIEGRGGFYNRDIGFSPKGWTKSGHKLQELEITLTRSGNNTLTIHSPENGTSWSAAWKHKLLAGPRLPGIYAWLDLGGQPGKPLMIGHISLVLRKVKVTRIRGFIKSVKAKFGSLFR